MISLHHQLSLLHILVMLIILLDLSFLMGDHHLTMAPFLLFLAFNHHLVKLLWTRMIRTQWVMMSNTLTPKKSIYRPLPLHLRMIKSLILMN
jgi:hypothetical protein